MLKNRLQRYLKLSILMGFVGLMLASCSTTEDAPYVERPVTELYNEGRAHLNAGRYEKAANSFDEVERQHPYSDWAAQAQLMSIHSYYKAQKYEKALLGIESFIALHPAYPDVAYAYYMRGLCYYEQTSTIERDQHITQLALEAFRELIKKHPHTRYARDARIKVELLRDHLAAREMDVGRYYQRRKAYYAAINRFKEVVLNYQTTVHIEESLHRLVELYLTLGLDDEAQKVAVVLGHNFPGSPWYADTYNLLQTHDVAPLKSKETSRLFNTPVLNKQRNKTDNRLITTDIDIAEPGIVAEETNYNSDLAKPIERLKSTEGYEQARQKVDDELSTFEQMGNWFSSKPDKTSYKDVHPEHSSGRVISDGTAPTSADSETKNPVSNTEGLVSNVDTSLTEQQSPHMHR